LRFTIDNTEKFDIIVSYERKCQMVGYAEIRKSTEYCHKGEYEVAEHWEDGCTVAVRYFKTKKLAEQYMEDNYGSGWDENQGDGFQP